MDQAEIADITEVEQLLARYAIAMTRDDVYAVIEVFAPDGTYSAFGDTYALGDFPELVRAAPKAFSSPARRSCSSTATSARANRHCASLTRPPTTCASATTRTPTGGRPRGGASTRVR